MITKSIATSLVELEREYNKRVLVESTLGSHFPGLEEVHIQDLRRVLEVGCGPGGWTTSCAQKYYPGEMQVTGVDVNVEAIAFAKAMARDLKLPIQYYHVEHLSGPFPELPDAYFDSISGQFLTKSLHPHEWTALLGECLRLLKPGGQIRLTDFEMGQSNAPAHEELVDLFLQAMRLSGRSTSPTNRHLGVLCELEPMLRGANFQRTGALGHMINYSQGAPLHREWTRDFLILSKQILPFLVHWGVATPTHVDMLYQQQESEVNSPSFHAILPLLSVWGEK